MLRLSHNITPLNQWLSNSGVAATLSTTTRAEEAPCNRDVAECHCPPEQRMEHHGIQELPHSDSNLTFQLIF